MGGGTPGDGADVAAAEEDAAAEARRADLAKGKRAVQAVGGGDDRDARGEGQRDDDDGDDDPMLSPQQSPDRVVLVTVRDPRAMAVNHTARRCTEAVTLACIEATKPHVTTHIKAARAAVGGGGVDDAGEETEARRANYDAAAGSRHPAKQRGQTKTPTPQVGTEAALARLEMRDEQLSLVLVTDKNELSRVSFGALLARTSSSEAIGHNIGPKLNGQVALMAKVGGSYGCAADALSIHRNKHNGQLYSRLISQ
jgi:hypothetical protein